MILLLLLLIPTISFAQPELVQHDVKVYKCYKCNIEFDEEEV